jgi:hypothetical protein
MKNVLLFSSFVYLVGLAYAGTPASVTFEQLETAPEEYVDKIVRLQCTAGLGGERLYFTKSPRMSTGEASFFYLFAGEESKKASAFQEIGEMILPIYLKFRENHPKCRWPAVEIEVDMIATFKRHESGASVYGFVPREIVAYRMVQIVAFEGDSSDDEVRIFPMETVWREIGRILNKREVGSKDAL